MNLLKWLFLLRKLDVQGLLAYPQDVTNSADCRRWVRSLLNAADVLVELTSVEFDDEIVETIQSIVDNDIAWNAIHGLFVSVVTSDDPIHQPMDSSGPARKVAEKYGFNPAIIMLIIQAISMLLRLLQSRRK